MPGSLTMAPSAHLPASVTAAPPPHPTRRTTTTRRPPVGLGPCGLRRVPLHPPRRHCSCVPHVATAACSEWTLPTVCGAALLSCSFARSRWMGRASRLPTKLHDIESLLIISTIQLEQSRSVNSVYLRQGVCRMLTHERFDRSLPKSTIVPRSPLLSWPAPSTPRASRSTRTRWCRTSKGGVTLWLPAAAVDIRWRTFVPVCGALHHDVPEAAEAACCVCAAVWAAEGVAGP